MQVAQLPCSHENGGLKPARRAASRSVSPAWYETAVSCFVELDHQRLGDGRVGAGRCRLRLGEHEPLDEHVAGFDADDREARLDRVHVGAGAADVEVGVRVVVRRAPRTARRRGSRAPSRGDGAPRAGRPTPRAAVRARRRRSPRRRCGSRTRATIGRSVVASALLMIEITGVMPLPPAKAIDGPVVIVEHEESGRAQHFDACRPARGRRSSSSTSVRPAPA